MSRKVQFALFSPQAGQSYQALVQRAQLVERLGFHSMWLVDHMWTRGMPELDHHECLALMSALSAETDKLRIGSLVLCNSYRNPALLAKSLCTIDHVSNGRLEVGLGAGWMDEEYRAYGYEFFTTWCPAYLEKGYGLEREQAVGLIVHEKDVYPGFLIVRQWDGPLDQL